MEEGRLEITVISAKDIKDVNYISTMDVYVVVSINGGSRSKQTTPLHRGGGTSPSWNTPMGFTFQDSDAQQSLLALSFKLRCQRKLGDKDIGEVRVSIKDLLLQAGGSQAMQSVTLPVIKPSGKPKGELTVFYKFSEISVSPEPQAPVTADTTPATAAPLAVPGAPVGVNPLAPVELHNALVLANPPPHVYMHTSLPWSLYFALHQPQRNYGLSRPLVGALHAAPTAPALFGRTSAGSSHNANPRLPPSHPQRITSEYSTRRWWHPPEVRPPHEARPEVQQPETPQPEVQPLQHEDGLSRQLVGVVHAAPTAPDLFGGTSTGASHNANPRLPPSHPQRITSEYSTRPWWLPPEVRPPHEARPEVQQPEPPQPEVQPLHHEEVPPEVRRPHPTDMQLQNSPELEGQHLPEMQLQNSPEIHLRHRPEVKGRHHSKMSWRRRMYCKLDMKAVVMALLGGTSAHRLST